MAKIQIKIYIKNNNDVIELLKNAIYNSSNNTIKYLDDDPLKTSVLIDLNNKTILRENKDIKFLLTFDINEDKILNCKLKGTNKILPIKLSTKSMEIENNLFKVEYETYLEEELISRVLFKINY